MPMASSAITPEQLESFDESSVAVLAQRLEDDDYPTPSLGWGIGTCYGLSPFIVLSSQPPMCI